MTTDEYEARGLCFDSQKSKLVLEQNLHGQHGRLKKLSLATGSCNESSFIAPMDYVIHLGKLSDFPA